MPGSDPRSGQAAERISDAPTLRSRLSAGETLLGSFVNLGHPALVEIAASVGFDFLVLDTEHAPLQLSRLEDLCRTAAGVGIDTVIRVDGLEPARIAAALDLGPAGVQVPRVASRAEAEACVRAARYAPLGERGLSPYTRAARYFVDGPRVTERIDRATLVVVQVEGTEGIEALDQILEVEGLDVVFLGPYDLSQAVGRPGRVEDPEVVALMRDAVARIEAAGLAAGTYSDHPEGARRWMEIGVRYQCLSVDVGIFLHGARSMISAVRAATADGPPTGDRTLSEAK